MQRILPRGEIESLDRTRIPRVRLPQRARVFADRGARLRALANASPVGGYLSLMACVAEAQQRALNSFSPAPPDADSLARATAHDMPPLQAAHGARDPIWRTLLDPLLADVAAAKSAPPAALEVCASLRRMLDVSPQAIDELADTLLAGSAQATDVAAAPFVMAALQVYWTGMAAALDPANVPGGPFGVCPLCGSAPVASVVRSGGAYDGHRYLCCPLCSCETHLVRVTCSYCSQTQGIA